MATVKHLWEKVAAIRRTKALGSDDLKVSNYELLRGTIVDNPKYC